MTQINLTDEEKLQIIEAINQGIEPSADLLPKMFPRTAEKFDMVALDRAKIPTLEYAGKRTKAAILAEGSAGIGAAPLQVVRSFGEGSESDWRNLIVQGDNLQFLKTCYKNTDPLIKDKVKGKVKLIYIDPPFGTGDEYGGNDGEPSYSAKVAGSLFIEQIRERLFFLKELLTDDGSIFVRLDHHFGHYIKAVLDEVFSSNFKNEMIINRIYKNVFGESKFIPTSTDSLFVYSKKENFKYFDVKEEMFEERGSYWRHMDDSAGVRNPKERKVFGKIVYPPQGKHFKYNQKAINSMLTERRIRFDCSCGYFHDDPAKEWIGCPKCGTDQPKLKYLVLEKNYENLQSNWTDIPGYSSTTGYPTENSEILLSRVIKLASKENDLILDCFSGSGTTAAVAEKLGRKWIACDFGKHSIYTIQKRILRISEGKKLNGLLKQNDTYGLPPKSFCILSSGAYDFNHIMDMRKNKNTYIDFALGLFQLSRDDEKASKFKVPNIYGVKDNNPVEVYPVWDERYLREIRIDEVYLQGVLSHTGGRLRGDYYIVTPESCTNISDTVMKNQEGVNVNFKILTFPYKILEDVSYKLKLENQPSSQTDINKLISSTSFYFNEDIEINLTRTREGIKINNFETKILDKDGKRFEGLRGLAMLLIDLDFNPDKPFDIDLAIYANQFEDSGLYKIDKLPVKVGVIAIDKHGNESKSIEI